MNETFLLPIPFRGSGDGADAMNWTVIDYVREEVSRQGHNVTALDGIERVGWMLDAWSYALTRQDAVPTLDDVITLGGYIERCKNANGIRKLFVRVGFRQCPHPQHVPRMLEGRDGR